MRIILCSGQDIEKSRIFFIMLLYGNFANKTCNALEWLVTIHVVIGMQYCCYYY